MTPKPRFIAFLVFLCAGVTGGCDTDSQGEPPPTMAAGTGELPEDGEGHRTAGMDEGAPADEGPEDDDGCTGERLEADLNLAELAGPGVTDGALTPGRYAISATYLRLQREDGVQDRFLELATPVIADAHTRDGLVAVAFAMSRACATARTLTVWESEEAMYGFAVGQAHATAMGAVGELSRGDSVAMHWLGDADEATWQEAARRLGDWTGRVH